MPRTRLVWHLFAGWCALVAVILTACFWMASVHMARLSDEAQRQRVVAAAAAVSHGLARGETDPASLAVFARDASGGSRIDVVVVPDGDAARGDTPRAAAGGANESGLLAEALAGRTAAASRYDAASGRRLLTVAAPHVAADRPAGVILVTADTGESDDRLRRAQRNLLAGHLACAAAAATAGFLLARRAALPLRSLASSASRLAAGDVDVPLPSTELVEVADLATALGVLRERIVESGITIGRQGTQQEAVLGSMIEGVLAIDGRQRIVGLNRAAADLLGLDPGVVVRRPLQEVVRNPDLRRFALRAIDCRAPVEDDLVLHGLRDRTIRLRGTALRDSSGEGGAVIVLNDVTEMQRLEMVRRDFVANVSHELKTPVASIKGFVETLLDGAADDPDDNRRFLGIIAKQSDRLAAIIEDLLALSRIEQSEDSGTLPVEPTPLAEVLAAAAADCALRAGDRGIELHTGSADGLVARVNAPLLEQAVINLVDNAIKHSEPGRSVWISATAAGDGDLMIQVRDEGCGIAPEHLPRLFERFYRVDKARSRRLGGTGLGLSIVKHIVQAHGGAVTVESASGRGSTFTIRMPLRTSAE